MSPSTQLTWVLMEELSISVCFLINLIDLLTGAISGNEQAEKMVNSGRDHGPDTPLSHRVLPKCIIIILLFWKVTL